MNLTRLSLGNPVAVIAATLLIFLMGGIGAERLQNGTTVNIGEIASATGSETQALQ